MRTMCVLGTEGLFALTKHMGFRLFSDICVNAGGFVQYIRAM